jgi:hypothetical protein
MYVWVHVYVHMHTQTHTHAGVDDSISPAKLFHQIVQTANFSRVLFISGGNGRDFSRDIIYTNSGGKSTNSDETGQNYGENQETGQNDNADEHSRIDRNTEASGQNMTQIQNMRIRLSDFTGKNTAGEWGVAGVRALRSVFEYINGQKRLRGNTNETNEWGA